MTLAGSSILIVDDDSVFRARLGQAMTERGLEVHLAANFEEAVASSEALSSELAVVDLRMPGKSGLEVVRELKRIDAATRVVVLTGYGSIATAMEAVRLGATHYLTKPVDADEILAAFEPVGVEGPAVTSAEIATPSLARTEWEHLQRVISDCDGNVSEAARRLSLHRRSLQRKLQKRPPRQ